MYSIQINTYWPILGWRREKVSCGRRWGNGEHIAMVFTFGVLLLITVALAILYYTSSTIINIRTCFLK
jgi:hypothetical protein